MAVLTTASRPIPAPTGVIGTIENIAKSLGVNANLALATALTESGLNPTAVGDNGTSFGLFQLHQGGELGNLTEQQAFSPVTNATVALTEFRGVMAANPSVTDPGQIAALAQRPANPAAYATEVNYYYNQLASGIPVQSVTAYSGSGQALGSAGSGTTAQLTSAQTSGAQAGCASQPPAWSFGGVLGIGSFSFSACERKAFVAGLALTGSIVILVIGVALVSGGTILGHSPVGRALGTEKQPSASTFGGSPDRRGSASSHSSTRSVGQEPTTSAYGDPF